MQKNAATIAAALALLAASAIAAGPASQPAKPKGPADNLAFWLNQGQTVPTTRSAAKPASGEGLPGAHGERNPFLRADALPGVLVDSQGRLLPGGVYTTRDKPWMLWSAEAKQWRRVPFITVLSITAEVLEEKQELKWRWKAMGVPERVYTGESYPYRQLTWKFRLIDGSELTGSVKGQPVYVELNGEKTGPFVLHERYKGPVGQKLDDLVHVRKIIISRRVMNQAIAHLAEKAKKAEEKAATDKARPLPKKPSRTRGRRPD